MTVIVYICKECGEEYDRYEDDNPLGNYGVVDDGDLCPRCKRKKEKDRKKGKKRDGK